MNIYSSTNTLVKNSTRFFSDAGLITRFNGQSLWWHNIYNGQQYALQINSVGLLIDYVACPIRFIVGLTESESTSKIGLTGAGASVGVS